MASSLFRGPRMRGGTRGRGNGVNTRYLRSDLNRFTVLSDHTQDGGTDSRTVRTYFRTTQIVNLHLKRSGLGEIKDGVKILVTQKIVLLLM